MDNSGIVCRKLNSDQSEIIVICKRVRRRHIVRPDWCIGPLARRVAVMSNITGLSTLSYNI